VLHCRGVRQADSLSPILFLLAMEPLHLLFQKAQQAKLLKYLSPACDAFRLTLYANDVALFIQPKAEELKVTDGILNLFPRASGLMTNLGKTKYYPIRCDNLNLDFLTSAERVTSSFPCTYLGLPLSYKKPPKSSLQPMLQKIDNKLSGWKIFLSYPGRETLIKSVLTAIPTFFITVFKPTRWFISGVDKFRRSFLWRGRDTDQIKGRHCLVNWAACLRPKWLGGWDSRTQKSLAEL
jgi:hypothetical protein